MPSNTNLFRSWKQKNTAFRKAMNGDINDVVDAAQRPQTNGYGQPLSHRENEAIRNGLMPDPRKTLAQARYVKLNTNGGGTMDKRTRYRMQRYYRGMAAG